MKITKVKVLDNNTCGMEELESGQLRRCWEVQSITPVVVGNSIKFVVVYLEVAWRD